MSQLERHFIEQADRTLSNFVRELGFTEIAEAYENIGKWYT